MPLQHWKKLGQRTLLEHPRLQVYEDDIELPDGAHATYLHFGTEKKVNSMAIIPVREDGKILIMKELSYPVGEFLWQWPGGAIETGEEILEATNRELMEEAGLRANRLEIIGEYTVNNRRAANRQCVVIARDLEEQKLQGDTVEAFESQWATRNEIQQMISQGDIINSYFLAAWALYCVHKK